jgi:hypothetical protein
MTRCRIGNWHEEEVYKADHAALYKSAREQGALLSQKIMAKRNNHISPATLAPLHPDGLLRFGEYVMIQNAETQGYLAVDTDDATQCGPVLKINATTTAAPVKNPQLRNAWKLLKVPSADDKFWESRGEADLVHYGQKFVVQSHHQLSLTPPSESLYVCSELKTPTSFSRATREQEVFCTAAGGQSSMWAFVYGDGRYRPEMEGTPVKANAVVLLQHQTTGLPLASTKSTVSNDFGTEYEVCCKRYTVHRAKHGQSPELACNLWAIVTAPAAADVEVNTGSVA